MNNTNDFALFIDELRESRNISREDFVDGIISLRQYYRFIKGESSLKNESINTMLEKLEVNSISGYGSFIVNRNKSFKLLSQIYSLLYEKKFKEANEMFQKIKESSLESTQNMKFYKFINIIINNHFKSENEKTQVNEIIDLIGYPNILKNEILTFYELTALFFISDYLIKEKKDFRIAEYTYETLKDEKRREIARVSNSLIVFYSTCSRNLGQIKEYEKALEIANEGIKFAKEYGILNGFAGLLYYKALGEFYLKKGDYKKSIIRLFSLLIAEDDIDKIKLFSKSIKKAFNVSMEDLITYKIKK